MSQSSLKTCKLTCCQSTNTSQSSLKTCKLTCCQSANTSQSSLKTCILTSNMQSSVTASDEGTQWQIPFSSRTNPCSVQQVFIREVQQSTTGFRNEWNYSVYAAQSRHPLTCTSPNGLVLCTPQHFRKHTHSIGQWVVLSLFRVGISQCRKAQNHLMIHRKKVHSTQLCRQDFIPMLPI